MAFTGCRRTPSGVLPPERMARLLADIYMAEAVVDHDYHMFMSDSSRLQLRQAVYNRNHTDAATVDRSYEWYGRNLDRYTEVNDRVIEILQERIRRNDEQASEANAPQLADTDVPTDSLNLWPGAPIVRFASTLPSEFAIFNVPLSQNERPGDYYSLEMRRTGSAMPVEIVFLLGYTDGSMDQVVGRIGADDNIALVLRSDTTLHPSEVYGYLHCRTTKGQTVFVDSITLRRTTPDPGIQYHGPRPTRLKAIDR